MLMKQPTIWQSFEMYSVGLGFGYEQYADMCVKYTNSIKPLSREAYALMGEIFNVEIELDMMKENDNEQASTSFELPE